MGLAMDSTGQAWPQIFRHLVVANSRYWFNCAREDVSQALREIPQILQALSYALALPEAWETARDLMLLVSPYLIRRGYGVEWETFLNKAIMRSPEENDSAQIDFLLQLGTLYRLQGRLPEAQDCFQKGLAACGQSNGQKSYWAFVNQLGLVARLSARQEEALTCCQQVVAEPSAPLAERAEALNVMGLVAYDRRQWDTALEYFEQALELYRSLDDAYQIARILNNRGLVFLRNTRWDEAEESYQEAIRYFQGLDNPPERYKAVMNLGNVFLMRKEYQTAISHYQEALGVFRQCHFLVDLAHLYNNLGMAYAGLTDWKVAGDYFRTSVEAWQRLEDAYNLANVLDNFGHMLIKAGQISTAQKVLNQALEVLNTGPDNPGNNRLRGVIQERLAQLQDNP